MNTDTRKIIGNAVLETLEQRQLMTTVVATHGHVLDIQGNADKTNNIAVHRDDTDLWVTSDAGTSAKIAISKIHRIKISGGEKNDTISVAAGLKIPVIVRGGAGNDTISTGRGRDSIWGGNGNDHIVAGAGNDHVDGGNGADLITGGAGNDTLSGGNGNDHIDGDKGKDKIDADSGDDSCNGGAGNDYIDLGVGHQDHANGGNGDDKVLGNIDAVSTAATFVLVGPTGDSSNPPSQGSSGGSSSGSSGSSSSGSSNSNGGSSTGGSSSSGSSSSGSSSSGSSNSSGGSSSSGSGSSSGSDSGSSGSGSDSGSGSNSGSGSGSNSGSGSDSGSGSGSNSGSGSDSGSGSGSDDPNDPITAPAALPYSKVIEVGPNEAIKSLADVPWPKKGDAPIKVILDYRDTAYTTGNITINGVVTITSADPNHQATLKLPAAFGVTPTGPDVGVPSGAPAFMVNGSLSINNIQTSGGINGILLGSSQNANIICEDVTMTDGGGFWRGGGANLAYFKDNDNLGKPRAYDYANFTNPAGEVYIDNSGTDLAVPQGGTFVGGAPQGETAIRIMDVKKLTMYKVKTAPWFYKPGQIWKQDVQLRPTSGVLTCIDCTFYMPDIGDMTWRNPADPIQDVQFIDCTLTKSPHVTSGTKLIEYTNTIISGKTTNKKVYA